MRKLGTYLVNLIQNILLKNNIIFLSILLIAAFSCEKSSNYVFQETKALVASGWKYSQPVDFKIPVKDTSFIYNLSLDVQYLDNVYPNQNLYILAKTKFPKGDTITRQVSLELFNSSGTPYGKCKGENCRAEIALQDSLYFNQVGDYYFSFEQFTRDEVVEGIQEITLKLEKTDKVRN